MKIFVAGGTGFVGANLCRELLDAGHQITLLVHKRRDTISDGIEQKEGDAASFDSFDSYLSGCDAVINLIGIIREFPSDGVTFRKLHIDATKNIISATLKAGISRYLQMSALGTRENAVSKYHQTKWEAEQIVRNSGLNWTIFRPSLIFGPGDSFVTMLAGLVRNLPAVPVIGDGNYRMQPIAATDVARCFTMALDMQETHAKSYELCGADRYTYNELLDAVGKAVGRKFVPKVRNPLGLMKLITPILQQFKQYPVTMDQIQMLTEESICDSLWRDTFRFELSRLENIIPGYLSKASSHVE